MRLKGEPMKAYHHLTHAPSLERQFKLIHRVGFFRGLMTGVLIMTIAGVIVRLIVLHPY